MQAIVTPVQETIQSAIDLHGPLAAAARRRPMYTPQDARLLIRSLQGNAPPLQGSTPTSHDINVEENTAETMEMEPNSSQSHVSIAVQDTPGAIDMDTVLSTTSAEPPAHPNLPVQGFVPVGDDELNSLSTSSSEDEENGPETNVSGIQNLPVRRAGRPPIRESQGRESSRNGITFSEGVPSTISENALHAGRAEVNEMNIANSPFVSDTPFFVSDRIIDRDTSDEESEQLSNRREYDSLHRRNNICPAERLEQVQDKIYE